MKTYNSTKLDGELKSAGIVINGCNSNGVVWDSDNNPIQDHTDVIAVLDAHDPTPPEPVEGPSLADQIAALQAAQNTITSKLVDGHIMTTAEAESISSPLRALPAGTAGEVG